MKYLKKKRYQNYQTAVLVTIVILLFLIGFLITLGKINSFLFINLRYSKPGDLIFPYINYLGDGLIYIPVVLYCIFFKREYLIPAIAAILICTVLSQFLKRFVYPDELNLRPISLEDQHIIIHKITGVEISTYNSFPSGHTSTAFTLALLLAYFTSKKLWAFILPLIALSVGYSRIYLAQHFVTDICGGIVVGLVSSFLSLLIYNSWLKKRQRRLENN